MKYRVDDTCGPEIEIEADTAEEAAQEYVDGGDYSPGLVSCRVWGPDSVWPEHCDITVEPEEPECSSEGGHDWQAPYELLGGLRESPGVWGHGGGVVYTEVCARCGAYRRTDTWAGDGHGGHTTTVTYREADEASLAWVETE